jgi:hypothetical protein
MGGGLVGRGLHRRSTNRDPGKADAPSVFLPEKVRVTRISTNNLRQFGKRPAGCKISGDGGKHRFSTMSVTQHLRLQGLASSGARGHSSISGKPWLGEREKKAVAVWRKRKPRFSTKRGEYRGRVSIFVANHFMRGGLTSSVFD